MAQTQTLSEMYGPARMTDFRSYLQARASQLEHAITIAEMDNDRLYSSDRLGLLEHNERKARLTAILAEIAIIKAALPESEAP